jgi:hypothetical protein
MIQVSGIGIRLVKEKLAGGAIGIGARTFDAPNSFGTGAFVGVFTIFGVDVS